MHSKYFKRCRIHLLLSTKANTRTSCQHPRIQNASRRKYRLKSFSKSEQLFMCHQVCFSLYSESGRWPFAVTTSSSQAQYFAVKRLITCYDDDEDDSHESLSRVSGFIILYSMRYSGYACNKYFKAVRSTDWEIKKNWSMITKIINLFSSINNIFCKRQSPCTGSTNDGVMSWGRMSDFYRRELIKRFAKCCTT